ncbi:hypothetical protein ILUMI_00348 [Ignelater luminosus]|uniref:Sodium/potassium-transporting ATPase subunit beta-2 n=1 Tax=Ignelater luminosus TaxID=2038154 RepID=A0A8K0DM34_IGNLU|nr:hypothetical protein ILUMI_00348 [Ignelater luminosus]
MDRRIKLLLGGLILVCLVLTIVLCAHFIRPPTLTLSFQPTPSKGAFIQYNPNNPDDTKGWINQLRHFLNPYDFTEGQKAAYKNCQQGIPPEQNSNEVCFVDVTGWAPCVPELGYHFNSPGGPCIFLTLNQNPEWLPEYYNSSAVLPDSMPKYLKEHIKYTEHDVKMNSKQLNVVWVSCEGETPADLEFIGPLQFFPSFGFGGQYFPVVNEQSYLKPLVAVYFERPRHAVVINIVCKAWAKNINHEKEQGIVHLELLIQDH